MKKSVKVSTPATIANLGSGFDTLGLALEMRNYVFLEESERFEVIEEESKIPDKDLVVEIIMNSLKEHGYHGKVRIKKKSFIPMKKGLGSSSAAIVSALGAVMLFFDEFNEETLFEKAVKIEGHPDNVAPAVFGGLRVSAEISGKNVSFPVRIPFEEVEIFIPSCEISTSQARKILPRNVSLSDAIFNIQRTALTIAAAFQGRVIKGCFEDRIHQRKRLSLCKEAEEFFDFLDSKISNPVFVCGSGPSIGVIGKSGISAPKGWKKMSLKTSIFGFKNEQSSGED